MNKKLNEMLFLGGKVENRFKNLAKHKQNLK